MSAERQDGVELRKRPDALLAAPVSVIESALTRLDEFVHGFLTIREVFHLVVEPLESLFIPLWSVAIELWPQRVRTCLSLW